MCISKNGFTEFLSSLSKRILMQVVRLSHFNAGTRTGFFLPADINIFITMLCLATIMTSCG